MAEIRQVFSNELLSLMEENPNIVVVDADLAKANGTTAIREKFPERAIDVGICEQNMASMAAGMASCGMIPMISSFTPFVTRRICDQIAISICYAKQNVKILGTDPGISAQTNGGTHMSMEDIGVLRSIPNIVIYDAVDEVQMKQAVRAIFNYNGPVYIRMFRKELPVVFGDDYKFDLFKADVVKEGSDISLFASGMMVSEAVKAAKILKEKHSIDAEVVSVHTIKPIDTDAVVKSLSKTKCGVVCDNHNIIGGLFSAISEVSAMHCPVKLNPVGVCDHFGEVGTIDFLKKKFNMDDESIVKAALSLK